MTLAVLLLLGYELSTQFEKQNNPAPALQLYSPKVSLTNPIWNGM